MKKISELLSLEIQQKIKEQENKTLFFEEPEEDQKIVKSETDYLRSLKSQNPNFPANGFLKTFENFDSRSSKELSNIATVLKEWDYPKERCSIFLCGNSGLGKTHLMMALFKRFAEIYFKVNKSLNSQVIWWNYFDLCISIRANPNDYQFWKRLKNIEILFIDDVGTIKNTEVIQDYLMAIIDYRAQNDKITVWSTNLTPEEIKKTFSERFTSRIKESCLWIQFPKLPDFRSKQFQESLNRYKERLTK